LPTRDFHVLQHRASCADQRLITYDHAMVDEGVYPDHHVLSQPAPRIAAP
jgi:hypothetical protein